MKTGVDLHRGLHELSALLVQLPELLVQGPAGLLDDSVGTSALGVELFLHYACGLRLGIQDHGPGLVVGLFPDSLGLVLYAEDPVDDFASHFQHQLNILFSRP